MNSRHPPHPFMLLLPEKPQRGTSGLVGLHQQPVVPFHGTAAWDKLCCHLPSSCSLHSPCVVSPEALWVLKGNLHLVRLLSGYLLYCRWLRHTHCTEVECECSMQCANLEENAWTMGVCGTNVLPWRQPFCFLPFLAHIWYFTSHPTWNSQIQEFPAAFCQKPQACVGWLPHLP